MRAVLSLVTALSLLGIACSSDNPAPSATGGTSGTAGTSGQAGTTATGGSSGTAGVGGQGATSGNGGSAQSGTGGVTSAGGSAGSGTAGVTSTGGSTSAGSAGAASGGDAGSAAAGIGGAAAGASGSGALGGAAGMSGAGAGGSSAGSGGGGAEQSAGCGEARTLQNGTIDITFNNASRNYILRVPENYDNEHPYRLVFAYAESGASAMSVASRNYFTLATLDSESENTIFVAPDAANGAGSWSASDVELTDAILAQIEADLCIDKTRIFATGFSFGGAMSLALACQRADVFRGVAFFSGADLTGSCTGTLTKPIAYYASQASGDSSGDPAPTSGRVKQAQFAEVNGCTPEPDATTFPAPGEPHRCTVYQGCSEGHPTVYCVFEGAHGWEPRDPGESMSWNAPTAWEFITQF